jgi:hypothetical protein
MDSPNGPAISQQTNEFDSGSKSIVFSSLLIPLNGSYNPCKQLDSKCKTSISEKYPFPFRGSLVHQQSLAKQPQHHPKSHLKRDPKKKQKRVIRFSIFAFKLVSKLEPK